MDDMALMIDSQAVAAKVKDIKNFKKRIEAAFDAAFSPHVVCWVADDDSAFKCGVAAIFRTAEGKDKAWVESQIDGIKKMTALLQASQAGLSVGIPEFKETEKRKYSLMALFQEAKKREDKRKGY